MRNSAVQAMEAICNPDSIPIFIELLQASSGRPSQEIAQGLACMLQKRPDKSAFAPVLNAVQSLRPQDWILQPELLNALAETKDAGAFEPLVQLAKSQSPWTRRAAAGALGLLGDRRAIPLLSALVNDPDADVRRAAAGALTDFSDFPAPPELLATLKDPNASPDINGMRALVASRDPKAIDAMIAAMPTNPTVVYWLGEAHDTRAVPALIAYLQNPAHGAESRATAAASPSGHLYSMSLLSRQTVITSRIRFANESRSCLTAAKKSGRVFTLAGGF
jgi:HEAT repeat protein